ncbi:ATP-binding cassette domain-containing protein [uncultured Campylobacter sp.]|uniref:ATP-binding cassette domain-containing protein n=1 Tax=uncultured Campylobacter sp. TaxID=218934 RepID=UPI0026149CC5|nr:ATP-binding cassette domain-containing protein [uncultured Campylobacter sp.]
MDLLNIVNLKKFYLREDRSKNVVFENFDLRIGASPRLISLTGPDGAGKSTLLKLICGIIAPDCGEIKFAGFTPSGENKEFVRANGYMSQSLGLYEELSVWQNLNIFAGLKGLDLKDGEEYLRGLLRRVGLLKFKDYAVDSLSGGMKQKLGVACAIAARPRLLVLDEPTVGVDPLSRSELWAIVREYLDQSGAKCIFSTAYFDEAADADLTLILLGGKIIAQERAAKITAALRDRTFRICSEDYQSLARRLMFKTQRFLKNSPLIDICPRDGSVDLLSEEPISLRDLQEFLNASLSGSDENSGGENTERENVGDKGTYPENGRGENFKISNESGDVKFNESGDAKVKENGGAKFKLSPREASLEDAYIFLNKAEIGAANFGYEKRSFDAAQTVIKVRDVSKKFGSFTAVENTSFEVKKGEIFGLLGPNGAGKTTTFRMICALLGMSGGEISVMGEDLRYAKSSIRSRIGYVSQKFSLYKKLSCYQNLEYFGRSYGIGGMALKRRIEELLSEFGLQRLRNETWQNLPFGAGRNLSMACALIHRPEILFLDEATSGADPLSRRLFWNRINALARTGVSVVVTTHFMEEAEYCDRFLIQDRGKILALGSPDEVCVQHGRRLSVQQAFINEVQKFRSEAGDEGF